MKAQLTRLLLVEDSPIGVELVREMLEDFPDLEIHHVARLETAVEHLSHHEVEVALVDLGLPDSEGLETLRAITRAAPHAPVVVLTAHDDEATGRAAVREGAQDYLVKGSVAKDALVRVLRYAIERAQIQARLRHTNQILRSVRNVTKLVVRAKDAQSLLDEACTLLVETRGYQAAWIGLAREGGRCKTMACSGWHAAFEPLAQCLDHRNWPACCELAFGSSTGIALLESRASCGECPLCAEDGRGVAATALLRHQGRIFGVLCVVAPEGFPVNQEERSLLDELADDLAFSLRSMELERRARLNEEYYRASFETPGFGQALTSCEGRFLKVNRTLAAMVGYLPEELEGRPFAEFTHPDDLAMSQDAMRTLLADQDTQRFEKRYIHKNGCVVWADVSVALVRDSIGEPLYFIACFVDVTDRKQAEELLRRQKDFSELLVQSSVDGILAFDRECRYTVWNSGMEAITGLRREVVLGRVAFDVFPFLRVIGEEEYFCAALAGETVATHDRPFMIASTGRQGHFEGQYAPLRAESGEVIGGLAVIRDVSERQRAEHAVQRKLDETHALLDASRAVLAIGDFEQAARVVFGAALGATAATAGLVTVFGRKGGDADIVLVALGERPVALDPSLPVPLQKLSAEVAQTGEVVLDNRFSENPWAARLPAGHTKLHNVLFAPLTIGSETVGVLGLANKPSDFTERDALLARAFGELVSISLRNARQLASIRRSEEQYRSLVENLNDVVFSVDVDGRIAYVSGAVGRYGFTPEEAFGRAFSDFVHPEDRPALQASFARALAGVVDPTDFRVLDKDGKVRFVRSSARLVAEAGQTVGLTGVLLDFTVQREIETQLRVAQKMEAVGRLAGGIAHDFNNILSVILNYAQFALEGTREGDPLHDDLKEIHKAALRAATLTRQLLAFSRKQVLQPEVLDLNAVVADMQQMLHRLIGEDIELTVQPSLELWKTRADRGQIEQVIMNLAVNSRDAMPDGGRLTIQTSNATLDQEFVEHHVGARLGSHVVLTVADTGCGMDSTTLCRVFEPFFTTKARGKGTGLGLATVYGIVKQTGGGIWVGSEIGKGTTFTVCLPRAEGTESMRARSSSVPGLGKGTERILVVEDEDAVRQMARRILVAAGYKVHAVANAGEALLLCEELGNSVDLLLTDVVMPGMGGRDLAVRLTALSPRLRVLYMSGYTDDAIGHRGVLEPGVHFIAKPFTKEQLTTHIREVLDDGTVVGSTDREAIAGNEGEAASTESTSAQGLTELPAQLRAELSEAVLGARFDLIVDLIDRAEGILPGSAAAIRRRLEGFDYDGILELLVGDSDEQSSRG